MDDIEIVSNILNGNSKFFEILIDRYQNPIYNLAIKMTRVNEDAEDITQIVFIKAYENLTKYNPNYKFFSWLYRIGINETINFINRTKRNALIDESLRTDGNDPSKILDQKEISIKVNNAILKLDDNYRELILLKHFENYSYEEISEIVKLDIKKVKSRLYSARQMLKDILSDK